LLKSPKPALIVENIEVVSLFKTKSLLGCRQITATVVNNKFGAIIATDPYLS